MELLSTFASGTVGDAARGGAGADRLAVAFAAGYQAALRALVPGLCTVGSFLVTEEGGGHPAAIRTQLSDGRLVGRKRFATQGIEAETLIVVASSGAEGGRNRLHAVMIPADRPGVIRTRLPPTPFCPEIDHAEVHLDVAVRPDEILPGDGYDDYLKLFRTIEDIHVLAATLGFVLHTATRFAWPRGAIERLLAQIAPASALAAAPREPAVHLALSGWLAGTERLLADLAPEWAQVDPDWRARWERDQPLLSVAHKARVQRTEAAWKRLA
ncbi:acyl-CoA dehydrogenase family protein [Sorangium sp. So ce834]|uniref:acyl-CoA dehydrogenase family protein n=1 Tax=Sorangium sp. So ce834 TaxID=3133321 RepID=UPI003F63BF40